MTALSPVGTAIPQRKPLSPVATTHPRSTSTVAPRLRYIVVVLGGIFAILGIQLLLSIAVSGGAYEIAALKGEVRKSQQDLQMVAEDISSLNAPGTLARLATAMGMVADNNPAYLRLSTGEVIGQAQPASAGTGSVVYSVTGGEEALEQPPVVSSVMNAVTHSVASLEEQSLETPDEPSSTDPTATTVSAPAPAPTQAPVPASPPRFGGSIPSPITR